MILENLVFVEGQKANPPAISFLKCSFDSLFHPVLHAIAGVVARAKYARDSHGPD